VGDAVDEPDPSLVEAARDGDPTAFEALVRRYQGHVWRLSFHLTRDRTVAEDVTQEAFVKAFRFLPAFRGDARFTTWLFSIARNCAIDEVRRAVRRDRTWRSAGDVPVGHDITVGIEVREAVAALPLSLRESVVLIDMFGLSYREAAGLMRIPEGTVKSRVHKARATLAQSLAHREESAGEG
jgi:RNA polymerase sigma-70 factor (ECF subfamily)